MKSNLIKVGLLSCVITLSCCNRELNKNTQLEFIDIESNINKMEIVKLSQFTDNIKYLALETYQDMIFQGIWDCIFSDSLILAYDRNKCLLYDLDGKFITKIGSYGKGPGEYSYIKNVAFGINGNILIQNQQDLLEYTLDGSFVNQYRKSFRLNYKEDMNKWVVVEDSLIFGHVANSTGLIENKAFTINKYGTIKYDYKNYIIFKRNLPQTGHIEDFAHIYRFDKLVYYKECFNDTLFSLNNKFELTPMIAFNLGRYKMPTSIRTLKLQFQNFMEYITLWEVFQTEDYLLLRCDFGNRFPAKRITSYYPYPAPGLSPSWYNTTDILGIYNKHTGKLIFCKPSNTDNPLFTSGLYNDIDCGPRFFPKAMINDSTMVMWIEAKQIKDHVTSNDFINNVPKYPEKKKKLEKLANKLTEFDNPVLMLVTFR
jgi:hypothetical protein